MKFSFFIADKNLCLLHGQVFVMCSVSSTQRLDCLDWTTVDGSSLELAEHIRLLTELNLFNLNMGIRTCTCIWLLHSVEA